jgi:Ribophorin I
MDTQSQSMTYTYLDTLGRPTVVLEKNNVVDEFEGDVEVNITNTKITYALSPLSLLQKPMAAAAYIFGAFLIFIVIARLDLNIAKVATFDTRIPEVTPRKNCQSTVLASRIHWYVVLIREQGQSCLYETGESTSIIKGVKGCTAYFILTPAFREAQKEVNATFVSVTDNLTLLAAEVNFDSNFSGLVSQLSETLKERNKSVTEMNEAVVEFLTADSSDAPNRSKITKMLHNHDEKMHNFTLKLNEHVSKMRF